MKVDVLVQQNSAQNTQTLPDPLTIEGLLRNTGKIPGDYIAEYIDNNASWISPNMVTVLGTLGVIGCDYLSLRFPSATGRIAIARSAFCSFDMLDGCLARKRSSEEARSDWINGEVVDSIGDKIQQASAFTTQAIRAIQNKDPATTYANIAAIVTSPLPSLLYSYALSRNQSVETKGGIPGARTILGIASIAGANREHLSLGVASIVSVWNVSTAKKIIRSTDHHEKLIEKEAGLQKKQSHYQAMKFAALASSGISLYLAGKIKSSQS